MAYSGQGVASPLVVIFSDEFIISAKKQDPLPQIGAIFDPKEKLIPEVV